ncbi:MAG: YcxB family protein [Clostridia bacterium]|nr:YcxB family protein [Clostridia bacterium]
MNENNINPISEPVEEAKAPVYVSEFLMSRDLFYEFGGASFYRTKKLVLFFLLLIVIEVVLNITIGEPMLAVVSLWVAFWLTLRCFGMKRSMKFNYERMVISEGKERIFRYELYEDRVVSDNDGARREYFYHQITKFYETKHFLLLYLSHNLCITVEKSSLNASVEEVKAFLMQKCTLVRKKRFINCCNSKKWTFRFLAATIAVSVLGTAASVILYFMPSVPEHFKGLDDTTTRSDILDLRGEPDERRESLYTKGQFWDVYEAEFLGVKGELLFQYLDGENLFISQFIIDSGDYKLYEDYEKAVYRTYDYFEETLSDYDQFDWSDNGEIDVSWSKSGDGYAYTVYETTTSGIDMTEEQRPCFIFQFNEFDVE